MLPWPIVGKPFPLRLTTIDGKKLTPEDLRGKVVIVDCWASWCAPCLALLPELKRIHEKWHKDGLEIVGINLDQDVSVVRAICEKKKTDWPQVMAPTDERARTIWHEASGISTLPRVFLIDREGNLRADTTVDLEAEVAKLMKKPGPK